MDIATRIELADLKAQDTAGRFIAASGDLELRQALVAQYREELAALNALKAAAK